MAWEIPNKRVYWMCIAKKQKLENDIKRLEKKLVEKKLLVHQANIWIKDYEDKNKEGKDE